MTNIAENIVIFSPVFHFGLSLKKNKSRIQNLNRKTVLTFPPVCIVSLGHKESNVILTLSCCFGI